MSSIDSARSYPTLSAIFTPRPRIVDVVVPDEVAANGSLHYTIQRGPNDDGEQRYGLYFDGNRVSYPEPVFRAYGNNFHTQLAQLDGPAARQIYHDLGVNDPRQSSFTAPQTMVNMVTPPPHRAALKPHVVTIDPAAPHPEPPEQRSVERKTPNIREAILLDDNMEEAERQIRKFIAEGRISVVELSDKSGYYANIVHTATGQVHQVGYSARKRAPWHVVFQLAEGINPRKGPYTVPSPQITQGRLQFPGLANNQVMQVIYEKPYEVGNEVLKLHIRDILGKLDENARRFCFDIAPISPIRDPENMRRFYGELPWWLKKALPDLRESVNSHPPTPVLSTQPSQNISDGRVNSPPIVASLPSAPRRVVRPEPQPGELNWRIHDLVNTSLFPSNVENTGVSLSHLDYLIPYVPNTTAPPAQELGWDEHGLPRQKVISRPLHDGSAVNLHLPPVALSTYSPRARIQPDASQNPVTYSPYQLVNFGGHSDIHTSYSFI